jgi:hypothetical protein
MELESLALVLLRRGPRAHTFDEAELEVLQSQHLAHLDEMAVRGKLVEAASACATSSGARRPGRRR